MAEVTEWLVYPYINSVPMDRCKVGLPLKITHGRASVNTQPDAPSASFTYLGPDAPCKVGDNLWIGEAVHWNVATYDSATVDYDDSAAVYDDDGSGYTFPARFVGSVASVKANEDQGQVVSWQIEGVGVLARLGVYAINLTRPAETDVQRIQGLCTAAGVSMKIRGTSTLRLAAETYDDTTFLAAIQEVCKSSGGLIWQSPDGTINYGTANHREGLQPLGVVPCEAIADGLVWGSSQDEIINEVKTKWATGESTHRDQQSINSMWGLRHADVDTICEAEVDAEQLGVLILARRAWPYWSSPDTMVYGHEIDAEGERLMSRLDTSTAVLVPYLMSPGAVPAELTPATVEGWIEQWDGTRHDWQLYLSDSNRWLGIRMRRYQEVYDEFATYALALTEGTYLDLATTRGAA